MQKLASDNAELRQNNNILFKQNQESNQKISVVTDFFTKMMENNGAEVFKALPSTVSQEQLSITLGENHASTIFQNNKKMRLEQENLNQKNSDLKNTATEQIYQDLKILAEQSKNSGSSNTASASNLKAAEELAILQEQRKLQQETLELMAAKEKQNGLQNSSSNISNADKDLVNEAMQSTSIEKQMLEDASEKFIKENILNNFGSGVRLEILQLSYST